MHLFSLPPHHGLQWEAFFSRNLHCCLQTGSQVLPFADWDAPSLPTLQHPPSPRHMHPSSAKNGWGPIPVNYSLLRLENEEMLMKLLLWADIHGWQKGTFWNESRICSSGEFWLRPKLGGQVHTWAHPCPYAQSIKVTKALVNLEGKEKPQDFPPTTSEPLVNHLHIPFTISINLPLISDRLTTAALLPLNVK